MILRFCKKFWPALAALAGLALSLLCAPGARSDSWPRPLWPTFPPRNEMAAIEEGTSFLHEAHFTYAIDRSALPDWVTLRIVTLLVEVGPALDVVALGDGEPVPCRHDGRYAIVTTDASRVEVIVSGHTWPFSEMGGVRVATLRDNKAWALSLTLDDGYTSQATTAKSLLDRYGYDATIAVIGGRIGQTFYGKDYASAEQLRDVVAAGWHLANHSYSHRKMSEMGGEAEALRDIQRANEAIMAAVPGYRPIVFTSPEADPAFEPVIKNHVDTLGFHLLQSRNWEGMVVDPELFVADDWQPTTLGRTQLLYDGSQFDQAHRWAEEHSGQHLWLSLHTHHVVEACDCVETATDILYRTYGAGGSDEVWVAPAPEVYQYLLTRDRVRVTELERYTVGTPSPSWQLPTPTPTPEVYALVLKQGRAGYAGTRDADIDSYAPTTNDGAGGSLTVRTLELKSALIAFALDRLPQDAVVQEAQLRLYGVDGTNEAVICLETYPLLREWQEREVTWLQAANGQPWAAPGAAAPGLDRTAKHSGLRGLVEGGGHWYTLDVTDAVRRWATGELANHGWLLKGSNNAAKQINLASSEYGDAALRPELYITYTLPPPIEEPTAPPGDGLLVGRALFSGLTPPASWSAPITVTLRRADDGSLAYRQVTTADAEGGFVLAALQPDLYDLELSSKGALPAVRCRLSIRSGLNLATVGPLALGDIVPDGYISARDWISLTQGLGTIAGQARYLPQADLNGDERVDLRDVAILSANYGRFGPAVHEVEPGEYPPPIRDATLRLSCASSDARVGDLIACRLSLDTGQNQVKGIDTIVTLASGLSLDSASILAPLGRELPLTDLEGAAGRLRYAAADLMQPLSGTVPLLELVFRVTGAGPEGRIALSPDPASRVLAAEGSDVLERVEGVTVRVRPSGEVFLPMIWRAAPRQALSSAESYDGAVALPIVGAASLPAGNPPIEARDVRVRGGYAYLTLAVYYQGDFVYIYDLADPGNPRRAASVGGQSWEADEIWLDDNRAYVANKAWGAWVLDVSTPPLGSPPVLGTFIWNQGVRPIVKGIHAVGDRLYLADEEYGLQVVDVSTPAAPRLLGSYDQGTFGEGVWVADGIAYVAAGRPGVRIVDVCDPARPRALQAYPVPVTGRSVDVQVEAERLYVAAEDGGVTAYDVSRPEAPLYLGEFDTFKAQKLDIVNGIVYLADDLAGLKVIDATEPRTMRLIAWCDTPGRAYGVSVADGYAYVADGVAGLQVVDLHLLTPTPTPTATPTVTPTMTPTHSPTTTPTPTRTPLPTVPPASLSLPLVRG